MMQMGETLRSKYGSATLLTRLAAEDKIASNGPLVASSEDVPS